MNKLTWPTVGLIAILGAIATVLAVFTTWGPGEVLGLVGVLGGLGGGAAVAGGVSGRVEEVHAQTQQISGRLNGELDARLAAANREQLDDIRQLLTERGIGA